jgi:hypothetical protein
MRVQVIYTKSISVGSTAKPQLRTEVYITSWLFVSIAYFRICGRWIWSISGVTVARGKPKYSEKTLSECRFFYNKPLGLNPSLRVESWRLKAYGNFF